MPKVTNDHTTQAELRRTLPLGGELPAATGRRAFLGATAALLPMAALPAVAQAASASAGAAPDQDAALLAACRDFMAAQAECDACNASDECPDDRISAAARWQQDSLGRLMFLRPQTPEGVRAKLRAGYAAMLSARNGGWGREEVAALAVLADATGNDYSPEWDDDDAA
jgi:hypothetical protein